MIDFYIFGPLFIRHCVLEAREVFKCFLEAVGFFLTKYGPVASHGELNRLNVMDFGTHMFNPCVVFCLKYVIEQNQSKSLSRPLLPAPLAAELHPDCTIRQLDVA